MLYDKSKLQINTNKGNTGGKPEMANWLQNLFKKNQEEPMEDFVLYKENENTDTPSSDSSADFSDTARLDISAELNKNKTGKFGTFFKNNKKMVLGIGIPVLSVLVILALVLALLPLFNPLRGYEEATVVNGNITSTMKTSGTLSANAHYTITSLVSGTVLSAPVEVGDKVEAGATLYQLDDSDAQIALKRAENQLEKSRAAGSYSGSPLRIYTTEAGVIQTINIRTGNSVTAGQVIGTLKRADETVVTITSSVSGTVSSVNVNSGVSVSAGSLVATVQDGQAELSRRASQYDQKSNEYDVESAKKQIENHSIVSPVSGIVTEKNAKVGDNIAMADTKNPMMVITDTSKMRFTFQVEENKLSEMKPGLRVSVTTDSVPNKTFDGKVKSISPEGIRNKNGKLMFDVEVLVENPGTLKSGMDVSAKIILATANNTIYVPAKALRNPDGKNAVVLVKTNLEYNPTEADLKKLKDAKIKVPKGCRLATVQYGINDGKKVQIISGLKAGEVVVYLPEWEVEDLRLTAPATDNNTSAGTSFPAITNETDGGSSAQSNEELRREIMEKVREKQNEAAGTETEV